jgi:transcriptional regulator GlxA family with amidase domain
MLAAYQMPQAPTPPATPVDPDETPLVRLPTVLSAGGGEQHGDTEPHDHPGDELVFIERGHATVRTAAGTLRAAPGTVMLFPRAVAHDQANAAGTRSWFVVFRHRGRRLAREPRSVVLAAGDPLRRWIPELCRHHLAADGVPAATAALLQAVLERLAALHERMLADRGLPAPLQAALRHLQANLAADMGSAALARSAGVSPSHLRTLFRRHLGLSPVQHHRRQRLDLAAKLLRGSAMPIAAVAKAVGWSDPDHFARLFARRYDRRPRAWRAAPGEPH